MAEMEAVIIEIDDKTYAVPLDTVKAFEVPDELKAELDAEDEDVSGFMFRQPRPGGSGMLDFPNSYVAPPATPPIRFTL